MVTLRYAIHVEVPKWWTKILLVRKYHTGSNPGRTRERTTTVNADLPKMANHKICRNRPTPYKSQVMNFARRESMMRKNSNINVTQTPAGHEYTIANTLRLRYARARVYVCEFVRVCVHQRWRIVRQKYYHFRAVIRRANKSKKKII